MGRTGGCFVSPQRSRNCSPVDARRLHEDSRRLYHDGQISASPGRTPMKMPMTSSSRSTGLNRRRLLAGAAATTTLLAAPAVVRAQGAALKVGVLLPRSGAQASIGQDCQRGADIA